MGSFDYHRLVVGYHGCDEKTRDNVLRGQSLKSSKEDYDWLGEGVYFWEHGPERAWQWATERSERKDGKVSKPAVIGAYINLGNCFDLLDIRNTSLLTTAYEVFCEAMNAAKKPLPKNKKLSKDHQNDTSLRYLDCAVVNWTLHLLAELDVNYQTVRGAFTEGGECYPDARIMEKTHIQIAVRDPNCIVGYFLPRHDESSSSNLDFVRTESH